MGRYYSRHKQVSSAVVRESLHSASVIMQDKSISERTETTDRQKNWPKLRRACMAMTGALLIWGWLPVSVLQARSEISEPTARDFEQNQHEHLDAELRKLREIIAGYSFKCYGSASKLVGPDILRKGCAIPSRFTGDGDSTLWNGLLCFTGRNPWACEAIKKSQSEDGRIWRSPRRMISENDGNEYPQASFSRDMARGVLLYILATRDNELAQGWSDYMSNIGALCPDHTDWSCDIRSQSYRRINHVMATTGLKGISFAYTVFPCLWPTYPLSSAFHETVMENRVEKNESFHLHLAAIDLLMDPHLKKPLYDDKSRQEMAEVLFRRKPYNLFYQYLAHGPTLELKKRILEFAPRSRPPYLAQWVWEREIPSRDLNKFASEPESPSTEEQELAFKEYIRLESMGWDFIFLIDLVLDKRP
ncbi:MAG: hypothetical protein CMN77_14190 [Spirochaetaceae bacterium]|nr:hypothetical protein [Spirochaetaceae bacterium]